MTPNEIRQYFRQHIFNQWMNNEITDEQYNEMYAWLQRESDDRKSAGFAQGSSRED